MKEFNRKIESIKFSLDKNDGVIASQNTEAISRHKALLTSKLQAAHTVKAILGVCMRRSNYDSATVNNSVFIEQRNISFKNDISLKKP